jgi:hypothetical protein
LRIGALGVDEQLAALQLAFRHQDLLAFSFNRFTERHPAGAEGLRPDWDSFVAIAQLVCGDQIQQWHARQWLQNEPMPTEVWATCHLQERCQGTDKVRNGLFTLMHLVGLPFCLTFDQVEDTMNAVFKHAAPSGSPLTSLLVRLSSVSGFSMLFFVQASAWQELRTKIPPMLHDRITEGYGVQRLLPLTDEAAEAVVRARMDAFAWRELVAAATAPPVDQPLFPFTAATVHQLRTEANSEVRPFLRLLQDRYAQLIAPQPPPAPVITAVLPAKVPSHEAKAVRIQGRHFRPEVAVLLANHKIIPVTYHPNEGSTEVLEITTPVGLLGEVEVRVQAADDSQRFATVKLRFEDPVPRPYAQHLDRQKFRRRREEMGLWQIDVARKVDGLTARSISDFEVNHWNPPDEIIELIATALGRSVADFRKDAPVSS